MPKILETFEKPSEGFIGKTINEVRKFYETTFEEFAILINGIAQNGSYVINEGDEVGIMIL